jgi:hypothetical protein
MSPSAVHPAALAPAQLLEACDVRRTRRSGPGGQHRNKVETAIVLTHPPTGVQGEANERRSRAQNMSVAMFRLRVNLALALRTEPGPKQVPSERWSNRVGGGRIAVSPEHDDFPALLAEALDVLAACDMDIRRSATWLHCTPSQLTKFLKLEPRALTQINARRRQLGLRPLR